jgi:outer membrane receptor protein involved in Fe transport
LKPYATGFAALVCLELSHAPALAQDALEEIVVTGTRIARGDFGPASPIVSVGRELFERTGSITVETTLNTLPQFVPGYTNTSNLASNGGQANVQLRGLGSTSTLVLIDGKRLIPANGNGVVDLNLIPASLIENVDIITGGASAVYGSDAVAGVVNFQLKEEFDGLELDAQWGQTERGDGTEYGGGFTAGLDFADGRGSVFGYAGYAERGTVLTTQRDFARYVLAYVGPGAGDVGPGGAFLPRSAPRLEEGRVVDVKPSEDAFNSLFAIYGYPGRYDPRQTAFGVNADGTVFTQGTFDPGSVLNFRGERDPFSFNDSFYTFNGAAYALQLPLTRWSSFARATLELNERTELYAQGLYSDYTVSLRHGPAAMYDNVRMPPTNPFIPPDLQLLLDSRTIPTENVVLDKLMRELGPRVQSFEYNVHQATLGLRGKVFASWSYDLYLQTGANDQTETQFGNALTSKIEDLTFADDGGVSICGGFNPFGVGSISAECAAYIAVDVSNRASVDQTILEASLSGPLLRLPAGELRAAFGVFYKEDRYRYGADPVATVFLPDGREDILGISATDDIAAEDDNTDVYVEAAIPLLVDRPGIRSLEAVVGYRYAAYASAGAVDAYKAELLYRPVDALQIRSSYQHAVRAPSVFELYLPQVTAFPYSAGDPCETGSSQRNGPDGEKVEALCLAQGFPSEHLTNYDDPTDSVRGFVGGNPRLDPETADTMTAGVVLTSPSGSRWLDRLQVSLDWYRIEIDDAIVTIYAFDFIARCFDRTFNPEFVVSNEWCGMFSRDAEQGDIVGAYEILRNSAGLRTSGVDLQLDWRVDVGPGELGVNWLVSHVNSFERLESPGLPTTELVGTVGSNFIGTSCPEWKWSLGLTYTWQVLTLDARWRHIDGMKDAIEPAFLIPHYDYFDLGASYEFEQGALAGLQIRMGVENAADKDPPIIPSWNGGNTEASQYDILGRRYHVSLQYSF